MLKQLVVTAGPDQGRVFPLPVADTLLLGRSRATETRLVDPHASRLHCRVEVRGDDVLVADNDSAGGTFVNGRRVSGPHALRPGDVLRIGQTELRLQAAAPDEASTVPPGPRPVAPPAMPQVPLADLA